MLRGRYLLHFTICVSCLLLLSKTAYCQEIIWASKKNEYRRADYSKVKGQNEDGVYVLKYKGSVCRRNFILEHFDKKLTLVRSIPYKIPNAELEDFFVLKHGILYFTKEFSKGYAFKLLMQGIDSSFKQTAPITIVGSETFDHESVDFRIEPSPDKSKFLVWYLLEKGDQTLLRYHIVSTREVLRSGETMINHKRSELSMGDAVIDDKGNLFILYCQSEKFRSKSSQDFYHYLFSLDVYANISSEHLINNRETFISNYKLCFNPSDKSVAAFGLYGTRDEDDNYGYFHIRFDCTKFTIGSSSFNPINRKTVSNVLGPKSEQKGDNFSRFRIRKLIPKYDGGVVAIAERTYITTQNDIFYVNSTPQVNYAKIYNNDEVLVLSLDSAGNSVWTDVINKNQSSINDGFYNGIIVMVNDDNFSILYNDKVNANADIIQVNYRNNGERTMKILMRNEEYYALLIPSEYGQVTANSIVIPINQNRDFTYIKLLY